MSSPPPTEDPTKPSLELSPPFHLVSCEYNAKDGNLLAGGCYNGQVCRQRTIVALNTLNSLF